jgi:hypothetical protein
MGKNIHSTPLSVSMTHGLDWWCSWVRGPEPMNTTENISAPTGAYKYSTFMFLEKSQIGALLPAARPKVLCNLQYLYI